MRNKTTNELQKELNQLNTLIDVFSLKFDYAIKRKQAIETELQKRGEK